MELAPNLEKSKIQAGTEVKESGCQGGSNESNARQMSHGIETLLFELPFFCVLIQRRQASLKSMNMSKGPTGGGFFGPFADVL